MRCDAELAGHLRDAGEARELFRGHVWKDVVKSPELMAQFSQFKNTRGSQKEVRVHTVRDQGLSATFVVRAKTLSSSPTYSSDAVLYGESQLAVFNIAGSCNGIEKIWWYATQNLSR